MTTSVDHDPVRLRYIASVGTIRSVVQPWAIAAVIIWTLAALLSQTVNGASTGGTSCQADPTCSEIGWMSPLMWLAGISLIVVFGWIARRRVT